MNYVDHEEARNLVEAFEFLEDWEDRYRFIMDMGRKLKPLPQEAKVESNRVYGCQSTVFMVARVEPGESGGDPPTVVFHAESDAAIVNGLIAILEKIYSGRTPHDILAFEMEPFLKQLGLNQHLSPTRRNGLHEMVKRIRTYAAQHAGEGARA
ncbi:MAG: SufE family protein [Phycisphaeraceae bacterium]